MAFGLALCAWAQIQPQAKSPYSRSANVVLGDQILFPIRTTLGPFSPADRAAAASLKLTRLARDLEIDPNKITTDPHETSTDILAHDIIIMSITNDDAAAVGVPRGVLALNYVTKIRAAISKTRGEYTYRSLLLGVLYAVLTTLVLIVVLIALRRFSPLVYDGINHWGRTRIPTFRIQSLELVSATRLTELLVQGARLARLGITVLLFYVYIPLLFSFFPWTRGLGVRVFSYVTTPIGAGWKAFISYLPSLLIILIVAGFCYLAIRIARFLFKEIERGTIGWPGFYPEWAMPTYRIVELLLLAFALVVMFPYLPGSESPAFKGVSIFLGVLFSLGSSSAISNVIAGVILTYARAFRVGDRVQIANAVGDIADKTLLATRVRTIKNVLITIPNSLVLGSHIINFSSSAHGQPLILHTSVTIGYDAPWRQIHALLIAAAAATPDILQEPKPFVLQTSLDDFYVSYEINAYTDQPTRMALIYSDLHQNIQDKFYEAGVEIMSPHYAAVRDGNASAIPESYLPSDYVAPGFRLFRAAPHQKVPGAHGADGASRQAPSC
jgi:small-conductance mechanosensitive channel